MIYSNYHSHTNLCDGSDEPEAYIKQAHKLGLSAYGFSSHAPMPLDCKWCMDFEQMQRYVKQISILKEKWRNRLQIYTGLEIDYIPNIIAPNSPFFKQLNLDYTIGSVHFVYFFRKKKLWEIDGTHEDFENGVNELFAGDFRKAATKYYEMIRQMVINSKPDIIGHFDKIKMHNNGNKYFSENSEWYHKIVMKTLRSIERSGAIIEVNTRGLYTGQSNALYPDEFILEHIKSLKIPIIISTDAHKPDEILKGFDSALHILQKIGFEHHMAILDGKWTKVPLK